MTKVYIIKRNNKRFNNKVFNSYEDARKYARKVSTKILGCYFDAIGAAGFHIEAK